MFEAKITGTQWTEAQGGGGALRIFDAGTLGLVDRLFLTGGN
jgi:hypothetical protein